MKVLIAIIAYNEGANILNCIKDLQSLNSDYDILLVDNSSFDNTVEIAKSLNVNYITHPINSGSAYGTLTSYFMYADRNNYDLLVQFDGDGQHIAEELEKIVHPILSGEADYVIGSRFLGDGGFKSYFFRRVGIVLFSNIVSSILRNKVTDVTSGCRAYNKRIIRFFGKTYKYEVHDTVELILLSDFIGAKIKEVSVVMRERLHGESEFNFLTSVSFPLKGIINILGTLLLRSKVKQLKESNDL
jgi:glycosyltransferase involved in cell wall biosynthesis